MKSLVFWMAALLLIGGAGAVTSGPRDQGKLPELDGAVKWLNSAPLNGKQLRGKVVLVNFWTYSCINSLRELPYMKTWAAKYEGAGLVVIGVHAPEFGFEKDPGNVKNALAALNITYPIPIDSNHSIWTNFRNEYWPADYFIDGKGRIRYHHFGEGEYEKSESVIQALLKENGALGLDEGFAHIAGNGPEAPPSNDVRSPETYVGYARTENLASREQIVPDSRYSYEPPARSQLNQWELGGSWRVTGEKAILESAGGKIVFRFHARDLHMVLGPGKNGKPIRFKVTLNGAAPGEDHGSDSAADGSGEVRQPRMYQLIRRKGPFGDASFEIEFLDPGLEAFSFTFG